MLLPVTLLYDSDRMQYLLERCFSVCSSSVMPACIILHLPYGLLCLRISVFCVLLLNPFSFGEQYKNPAILPQFLFDFRLICL